MSKYMYQSTMHSTIRLLAENLSDAMQPAADRLRRMVRLLVYGAGAGAILTLYMIIPSMIALSPLLSGNWSRLLVGLALLAIGEAAVITVLARIGVRDSEPVCWVERRGAVRVAIDFDVEVGNVLEAATGLVHPLQAGRALNASRDGLAVLLDEDWPTRGQEYVSLRMSIPGEPATVAKARIVASEKIGHGSHSHRLLRLRLVPMDHEDRNRYFQYLTGLETSVAVAA